MENVVVSDAYGDLQCGLPLLVAISRKDFIGAVSPSKPAEREPGTLATLGTLVGLPRVIARVHDVAAAVQYLEGHTHPRQRHNGRLDAAPPHRFPPPGRVAVGEASRLAHETQSAGSSRKMSTYGVLEEVVDAFPDVTSDVEGAEIRGVRDSRRRGRSPSRVPGGAFGASACVFRTAQRGRDCG